MPISSGANDWPRQYFAQPAANPAAETKVTIVPRPPSSPLIRPAPPAPQRSPQILVVDGSSLSRPASPSRTVIVQQPDIPPRSTTTVIHESAPSTSPVVHYTSPAHPAPGYLVQEMRTGGYPPVYGGPGYGPGPAGYRTSRYPYDGYEDECSCGDPHCCADPYFTTGVTGANAGCCNGGMFGSRRYPFHPSQNYVLKGTGRGRCCACVWGTIIGLLFLGLLLGLLLGLMPAVQMQNAKTALTSSATYKDGYWLNGAYYYAITNPPDLFYYAFGPGIPCDTLNPVTASSTLPNCNSITTSYVLAAGVSIPTTTLPWKVTSASRSLHPAGKAMNVQQIIAVFLSLLFAYCFSAF